MSFNSTVFLFLALPVLLGVYFISPKPMKNIVLFVASLLLYAFGEPVFIVLLLTAMAVNFASGLLMEGLSQKRGLKKAVLTAALCFNLGILVFFKYFMFLGELLNGMLGWFGTPHLEILQVALPVGISFFVFQGVSYVVDVYRGEARACRSFIKFGTYLSFFATVTAGPIVRYADVAEQFDNRRTTLDGFSDGLRRFLIGLGQKVIFANYFGKVTDDAFSLDPSSVGGVTAWVGILFYTLQIYFDFAGYSSMAIGIAKMFGFDLKENFNHPYEAISMRDFWSRWHISLSTWFRDYIYFPMGGNRKGAVRMYLGLLTVFVLSGVWHGAALTFLVWGLYHALCNIFEKLPPVKRLLDKIPKIPRRILTLLAVTVGWVFFRSPTVGHSFKYLGSMLFINGTFEGMPDISVTTVILWLVGALACTSLFSRIVSKITEKNSTALLCATEICVWVGLFAVFCICIPIILTGGVTSFIYQQF